MKYLFFQFCCPNSDLPLPLFVSSALKLIGCEFAFGGGKFEIWEFGDMVCGVCCVDGCVAVGVTAECKTGAGVC